MSSGFIESGLSPQAADIHRALASLQEELEAIDDYHQRMDATHDAALKALLAHNRDDEMEHAAMLMEWLRCTLPAFDVQMKTFLFAPGSPTEPAAGVEPPLAPGSGLGLGSLK